MKTSKVLFALLCLVACFYSPSVKAQNSEAIASQNITVDKESEAIPNSLLWKIEGKGIQSSYLYGTFHILPQKDFLLKDRVKAAFDASSQIVMELDMDDPNLQAALFGLISMKDGQTLDKLMNPADYKKLGEILSKSTGFSIERMNDWKPYMLSSLLIRNYVEGQPASFEGTFVQMATEQGKEILGLETAADQMSVFDAIPYEEQLEDISEMLNEEEKTRTIFRKMLEMYKKEDVEGLYTFTSEYIDNKEQEELILINRNKNWIPKIGELAQSKTTFFGVGAGHLCGEQGLINLLRKAGYTVSPVQ